MSNMVLVKVLTPSAVVASTGTNGGNVATPDPKEVWASTAAGDPSNLDFDFGANVSIDALFIGFISGGPAPSVVWSSGTASYTATTNLNGVAAYAATASPAPPRRHGFWKLGAAIAHRYHRIRFDPAVAGTATVGIVAFGLCFQPTHNREWGGGRQIIDTGVKEELLGGGFGIGEGARKAGYRWTFGDLTDAEVEALYDLALSVGETRAILAVEDPAATAGLNERIHYGLFDRFEAYERQNPNLTRWSLSMREWV